MEAEKLNEEVDVPIGNQTIKQFKGFTKSLYDGVAQNKKAITIFSIAVFSICAVLMVVAGFWDYPIADALNNPNERYSRFLQDYGEWPAPFIINSGFFAVLFVWLIRTRKKGNYLFLLGLIPLSGAFTFGFFFTYGVLVEEWWLALIITNIGVAVFITAAFLMPKKHLVKILYFLMLCYIISTLAYFLMLFTKWLWGRVRFRDIGGILDTDIGFTRWFIINGPNGNEAFFSGHVLAALSFTFVWMIPPIFNVKNKIAIIIMYGLSSLFAVSMMYARIVTGAHYLSDVTFSVIVFLAFNLLILKFIFFRKLRKEKKLAIESNFKTSMHFPVDIK